MKHESQPDWGLGLVTNDLPQHWEIFFEHGGPRKFVKSLARCLVAVPAAPADVAALAAKAAGRNAATLSAAKRLAKAAASPRAKARFENVKEQIAAFERLFPGGFEGDAYIDDERGRAGVQGKNGRKQAAIALAQSELSAERFESESEETLFNSAKKLVQGAGTVQPAEGATAFRDLESTDRAGTVAALKQLLHGEGDYDERLEAFARGLRLQTKDGKSKPVTWPLATVFGAFFNPQEHICIKAAPFASQALTVGLSADGAQVVTASGYRRFLQVARKTREDLETAGQRPRDLLDIYSLIWCTHHEKPA
ncbi:MAG TPA: hypothetical protein VEL28_03990 [Candidatus Binatia bacterium]|nr:hypothetical protein [Candidatus Binatia bacterium]